MNAVKSAAATLLGFLVLIAIVSTSCGGGTETPVAAPAAPPTRPAPAPTVVARVDTVADVVFTDGRRVQLTSPSADYPACDNRIKLPVARNLLVGKTVQVVPQRAGGPDVRLPDGRSYFSALQSATTERVFDECYGSSSSTAEPGDTDVEVDVEDDDDGESRFCRGRIWC